MIEIYDRTAVRTEGVYGYKGRPLFEEAGDLGAGPSPSLGKIGIVNNGVNPVKAHDGAELRPQDEVIVIAGVEVKVVVCVGEGEFEAELLIVAAPMIIDVSGDEGGCNVAAEEAESVRGYRIYVRIHLGKCLVVDFGGGVRLHILLAEDSIIASAGSTLYGNHTVLLEKSEDGVIVYHLIRLGHILFHCFEVPVCFEERELVGKSLDASSPRARVYAYRTITACIHTAAILASVLTNESGIEHTTAISKGCRQLDEEREWAGRGKYGLANHFDFFEVKRY